MSCSLVAGSSVGTSRRPQRRFFFGWAQVWRGEADHLRALFREVRAPRLSLHLPPAALEAMTGVYAIRHLRPMRRLVLNIGAFRPVAAGDVRAIGPPDLAAVSALFEDGHRRGEGPAFFYPAMLGQATFRGIWEGDALVAIAGTHVYSRELGVCAVGNVYTRSDRRGRGLAARVTSAVVAYAIDEQVRTIVLNVAQENTVAQRVYERLGFAAYCEFVEGEAARSVLT